MNAHWQSPEKATHKVKEEKRPARVIEEPPEVGYMLFIYIYIHMYLGIYDPAPLVPPHPPPQRGDTSHICSHV